MPNLVIAFFCASPNARLQRRWQDPCAVEIRLQFGQDAVHAVVCLWSGTVLRLADSGARWPARITLEGEALSATGAAAPCQAPSRGLCKLHARHTWVRTPGYALCGCIAAGEAVTADRAVTCHRGGCSSRFAGRNTGSAVAEAARLGV